MAEKPIVLGLRENLGQFALLVTINAFVGAMVGLERTVLPLIAEHEFNLASKSVILSFIFSFGIVKAFMNFLAGRLSDTVGRKKLLVLGWLIGLPVPVLVMVAPSWSWIVFANILLGANQGLCWSTTVIMKIDLVGPRQRGLATGLNEFAGYLAVALSAFATGYIASEYSLRPQPFYIGVAFASLGLLFSVFLVKETKNYALNEARSISKDGSPPSAPLSTKAIFALTSWKDRSMFACSQAGLVNNLNDGMVWGLLPLFFASANVTVEKIGVIAAVYPATWGILQLWMGALSDKVGRKWMIASGMWIQAVAIWLIILSHGFVWWIASAALLGLGTAFVYPTLLAAISDVAHPTWRASAVGVYRLWRDLGYAVGALLAGLLADFFGLSVAIAAIGGLTCLSGIITAKVMYETLGKNVGRT